MHKSNMTSKTIAEIYDLLIILDNYCNTHNNEEITVVRALLSVILEKTDKLNSYIINQ